MLAFTLSVGACGTMADAIGVGLERVGAKQPVSVAQAQSMLPITRDVTLRVHAQEALNVDAHARPLSVVLRLYRLRSAEAFTRAPLAAFKDAETEKAAFGSDVIAVREIVLTPRQRYEVIESLPPDVQFVGVVALFRVPSRERWRFAFERDAASKTGITLGAHACALSVALGQPVLVASELTRLAGARCEPEQG